MSTSSQPLKYLWTGYFDDGRVLEQPADDRYSKHDDDAEWNPSAFRDLTEHQEKADLIYFDINDGVFAYGIDLNTGRFGINGTWFSHEIEESLKDRKLIYYRKMKQESVMQNDGTIESKEPEIEAYVFGYEGTNSKGEKVQNVICVV